MQTKQRSANHYTAKNHTPETSTVETSIKKPSIVEANSLSLWHSFTDPANELPNAEHLLQQAAGHIPLVRLVDWLNLSVEGQIKLKEKVSLLISGGDDWQSHLENILSSPRVAIEFSSFTDGRGYSIAYQLIKRHRFTGELRAYGDVFKDLFFNLRRTGFQTYQTYKNQLGILIEESHTPFTHVYQPSADHRTVVDKLR